MSECGVLGVNDFMEKKKKNWKIRKERKKKNSSLSAVWRHLT